MRAKKILSVVCVGLAFLLVVSTTSVRAEECCYFFNPLLLPFVVAGAALGTAAAITTGLVAPWYPYNYYYEPGYYAPAPAYYGPGPYGHRAAWVRGHYDGNGVWVPGHWRNRVWVPGHHNRYGDWIPGHWG
jgi:hypothetical protein